MRSMAVGVGLAVVLVMSISAVSDGTMEGVSQLDDMHDNVATLAGDRQPPGDGDQQGSLSAEDSAQNDDGADTEPSDERAADMSQYHKLQRTEMPSYAAVLSTQHVSHRECKEECDKDEKCEGFKFVSGTNTCDLLAHKENAKSEDKAADKDVRQHAVKEVVSKMHKKVSNAAQHAADTTQKLDSEEESLRTVKKKEDMAHQAAKVAEQRDALTQKEIRTADEILKAKMKNQQQAEETAKDEYKAVKVKNKSMRKSLKDTEARLAHTKTHLKELVTEQVDAKMGTPMKEKKEKNKKRMSEFSTEAENMMAMERKRYEHMKQQADAVEKELNSLPDHPEPQDLPEVPQPFALPKLSKAEQLEKDESSSFVQHAATVAEGKAAAKEKNEKFLAKEMNLPAGASKNEMVKEAVGKAEKKAIAGLANQKAEVKELTQVANKYLNKSSHALEVRNAISHVIKNATVQLESTEDVDTLHQISKDSEHLMRNSVEQYDAHIKARQDAKADAKELKAKQANVEAVNEAREAWAENRLIGFPDDDKAQFRPAIMKLSKKIESKEPSRERILSMNEEVHQLVTKARKKAYRTGERDKLAQQLRLLEDKPDLMLKYAEDEERNRRQRRTKRRQRGIGVKFDEQTKLAEVTSDEKDAKKNFQKQEKKLEAKTFETEAAELEHRSLTKGVDKLKQEVKALKAKVDKGESPKITTETVTPEGKVVSIQNQTTMLDI